MNFESFYKTKKNACDSVTISPKVIVKGFEVKNTISLDRKHKIIQDIFNKDFDEIIKIFHKNF